MTRQLPREQMERLRAIVLDDADNAPIAFDTSRFVAAMRAKERQATRAPRRKPATSREACIHCGIPMLNGCDHFEPFVPIAPAPYTGRNGAFFFRQRTKI